MQQKKVNNKKINKCKMSLPYTHICKKKKKKKIVINTLVRDQCLMELNHVVPSISRLSSKRGGGGGEKRFGKRT